MACTSDICFHSLRLCLLVFDINHVPCSMAETDNTNSETVSVSGRSSHGSALGISEDHRNHVRMKRAVDLAIVGGVLFL